MLSNVIANHSAALAGASLSYLFFGEGGLPQLMKQASERRDMDDGLETAWL